MKVIVCLDDRGGMMFNHRRQSRDREVIRDILQMTKGEILWMNGYSASLFEDKKEEICVDEDFLEKAGKGEFCFVEDKKTELYQNRIEQFILYRWNRKYPADFFLDMDWNDWVSVSSSEFPGNSHEKLTKEIYDRKGD